MGVLYFLFPIAGLFVLIAVLSFRWAALDGQFDDLQAPPARILFDDPAPPIVIPAPVHTHSQSRD